MIATITVEHEGKVVTELINIQETGRASFVKILHALGIPNDKWKTTVLQVTVAEIP